MSKNTESKNNPANRRKVLARKVGNGVRVQAVKYMGKSVGHGNYMAGSVGGKLVLDGEGRPLRLSQIGNIE